jgi:hypothetical protein
MHTHDIAPNVKWDHRRKETTDRGFSVRIVALYLHGLADSEGVLHERHFARRVMAGLINIPSRVAPRTP